MTAGSGVDQLGIDPHLIAYPANTAMNEETNIEPVCHMADVQGLAFVDERGITGDDQEIGAFRQAGDQIIGHAIGKIFLFEIDAQIVKR